MNHLTDEQFRYLYDNSLDPAAEESVMNHLDECETCLDRFNSWFEVHTVSHNMGQEAPVSNEFQRKLMRRINHVEVGQAILRLGYFGFVTVFSILIKSILAIVSKSPQSME
jgi:hypothetical protein